MIFVTLNTFDAVDALDAHRFPLSLLRPDPDFHDGVDDEMPHAPTETSHMADDEPDETNVLTAEDLALDRLKTKKRGFTVVGQRRCSRQMIIGAVVATLLLTFSKCIEASSVTWAGCLAK